MNMSEGAREGWEILIFVSFLLGMTPLLGGYIARVFSGKPMFMRSLLGGLERSCYWIAGVDAREEMSWTLYAKNLLIFHAWGLILLFSIQRAQGFLPFNPEGLGSIPWPLALNNSLSFVTNTNWQSYAGEVTMSYFTQMVGVTVQNFLSAATGMGVLLALIRGITRQTMETIGNFWVDLVQSVVYLLLPLSLLFALLLVCEGVVETFSSYTEYTTLEGREQALPLGPVASQVAIKQLGSNGGGFFGANGAHPLENPSPLSNFFEMIAILLIPAASTYAYGKMIGSRKEGRVLLISMGLLWVAGLSLALYSEHLYNPVLDLYPVLEGKETRLGTQNAITWVVSTTATSNGSVNSSLSSLSPLAGGVALLNMMLGELIFGGVGVGLCSMIMFVLLTVFLSGLMVGRTPEYLGKKIEKREMQWVMLAVLAPGALVLMGSGFSIIQPASVSGLLHRGPHGLSEMIYAFTSTATNNGSAFGGLKTDTTYYHLLLGVVMLLGRLSILLPSLAIAGLLVRKKQIPASVGTFSTENSLFCILLLSVILIVGALAFFPALSLGPIVEHLLMVENRSF